MIDMNALNAWAAHTNREMAYKSVLICMLEPSIPEKQ